VALVIHVGVQAAGVETRPQQPLGDLDSDPAEADDPLGELVQLSSSSSTGTMRETRPMRSASACEALPEQARRRIRLITLPMDDVDENAIMVNAIQGQATVIVQKSLVEGFGLTVAEGMWKAKPVVASAVGGIVDQIAPGTGVLLDDPTDLDAFGDAVADLLERPDEILKLGEAAKRHVLADFVGDVHLLRYAALIEKLVAG
jgi:glycosyltransferase involved in cell wall biosynthesis